MANFFGLHMACGDWLSFGLSVPLALGITLDLSNPEGTGPDDSVLTLGLHWLDAKAGRDMQGAAVLRNFRAWRATPCQLINARLGYKEKTSNEVTCYSENTHHLMVYRPSLARATNHAEMQGWWWLNWKLLASLRPNQSKAGTREVFGHVYFTDRF